MFRMGLLLVIIACIALAITNPGEETHRKAVYNQVSSKAGMEGFAGKAAGALLSDLGVVPLKYNNYIMFSTMTFGEDTLSVGLLTKVWPTNWDG